VLSLILADRWDNTTSFLFALLHEESLKCIGTMKELLSTYSTQGHHMRWNVCLQIQKAQNITA